MFMVNSCLQNSVRALRFLIISLTCFPGFICGQNSEEPKEVSTTYYFENVNVIQKPGTLLPNTKLIVKNGLIEDVGVHLKVPANAIKIKADSMFIYAGFIDAFSNAGIPKIENKDTPKIPDPGNPPLEIAGITPQYSSFNYYKSDDKSVGELRSTGFTLAHVTPRGYMLPGQTCLFLLKEGDTDVNMVKKDFGMSAQFTTNRSVYPSTVIGVMARFRDLYKNSEILLKNQTVYEANSFGLTRPLIKKEESAFQQVTQKKQAVFFNASSSNQISRALQLQKELGFQMVLANVKEGECLTTLAQNPPVRIILSLDLPEETKEIKKEKGEEKKLSEEEKKFEESRKKSLQNYESQAAMLEKENIPFSFSSLDAKPSDILKNIRRMIKSGLSENAALAALTTTPADWFGINKMAGTVEKGKWANLIICDSLIFNEKTKIKWVFVEGKLFENKNQETKGKGGEETEIWAGKWSFSVDFQGQSHTGTLWIQGKKDVSEIYVTIDDYPNQKDKATDIQQKGNQLSFVVNSQNETGPISYQVEITLEKSSFSGNVTMTNMGTFPITGDKKSGPNQ